MFFPTIQINVTPRSGKEKYNVQMTQSLVDTLALIFEFKILGAGQLSRFLKQKDSVKYSRMKLRRMWLGGLLESLDLSAGGRLGMPRYYMLSKLGLKVLMDAAHYDKHVTKSYPTPTSFIHSGLFQHDAQVVELASLEAMNQDDTLTLSFTGELTSMTREYRSDKRIEVLTPDYTVEYHLSDGRKELIYTEFERTNKSTTAMLRKVERYALFFGPEENKHRTLRLIFQNESMERAFWLAVFLNKPGLLQRLRVVTTNMPLLHTSRQFLEPIYATERTATLKRVGRVVAEVRERVRMVKF